MDRDKMERYEISVSETAAALQRGGMNIPLGKRSDSSDPGREWSYRSLGEYNSLMDIGSTVVRFAGNDVPVRISDIARVVDTNRDLMSLSYFNGQPSVAIDVFRQTGANTIKVSKNVRAKIHSIKAALAASHPGIRFETASDGARPIRANVNDVTETIAIGIVLTILVVFLFLGNWRSTAITAAAIPNSLIGAFIFVQMAGFSVNMLTLLGLSLAVGLLIDDSIVVRENIFHHLQSGKSPFKAAVDGVREVTLPVIATTLTILAVFAPIAYIQGIAGKFLKEFGLTVCFIMIISTFDALFVGPMLSAYWYKPADAPKPTHLLFRFIDATLGRLARAFMAFQDGLTGRYAKAAAWTQDHAKLVLGAAILLFVLSLATLPLIPKTFLPPMESGEVLLTLETPPGSSLARTRDAALEIDRAVREDKAVKYTSLTAGDDEGEATGASVFIKLKPSRAGKAGTAAFKDRLRKRLGPTIASYRVKMADFNTLFGGERPFTLNLISEDSELLQKTANDVLALLKTNPDLKEPDLSYRPGKPEVMVVFDRIETARYGVSPLMAGAELRGQIQGSEAGKFRERGEEWDIRVRMEDQDRDLRSSFARVRVPNLNYSMVGISDFSSLKQKEVASSVYRINGRRVISVTADIASGKGLGDLMGWVNAEIAKRKILPPGVTTAVEGEAEQYSEVGSNMLLAFAMAVIFIFLVLASLYNSFLTPWGLLLPLPLAVSGAFIALAIGRQSLNIFSMIAVIMLMGISTKNSILLVDYATRLREKGMELRDALVEAGRRRLRPILMTSMATIAGTLPLAMGLNESSRQRASMGWVIIGGVISSTLLSLFVVPAALSFFRRKKKPAGSTP
jgi:HAE1 family hydrophobic/amphiphilic exporter-1